MNRAAIEAALCAAGPAALPALGFLRHLGPRAELEGGTGWAVVRGTSDRRWCYLWSDPSADRALLAAIGPDDRGLAAIEPRHLARLGRAPPSWISEGELVVYSGARPPPIAAPAGVSLAPLAPSDAGKVDAAWEYRGPGTLPMLERCLATLPSVQLIAGPEVAGWCVVLDDGAIGAGHVAPAYRGRGLFQLMLSALAGELIARGRTPFFYTKARDGAALVRLQGRGWRPAGTRCWAVWG